MRPGIDPKVDYAFKKLFGSESNLDLLSDVLHAILQPPPGRQLVDLVILNPFNDKDTTDDKLSVLDIKARDASGRLLNIEMQMIAPWFFPQRVLYYWAKVYQQQLIEGSDYRDLRPTVAISFLDSVLFRQVPALHHHFSVVDPRTQLVLSDHLDIHIVELPKFVAGPAQLSSPFDVWCFFLRHGETLDSNSLPAPLNTPIIHRALEVLNVMTQNDRDREIYEGRLKQRRDRTAELEDAREQGVLIGRIQAYQELFGQAPTSEAELKNLSLEQLSALLEQLRKQASRPSS
jgi:predicted transposase/invertase (TIGR01784 family)